MSGTFDLNDLKRRMQASIAALRHELGGLRTGRASASLVEPIHVEAYGQSMPLAQVATISVPEPRALAIQVWDKAMVIAVDKAIRAANLGLSPTVEGQILRIRMPEMAYDLPGGARRLVQKADGYVATVVNGEIVSRHGELTGALPGRVLRGARPDPAA